MHHLAIDIGASSGRIIHGQLIKGKLFIEEIYRFENSVKKQHHTLCWDIDYLFQKIMEGLQLAKVKGIHTCTIGIDTWAVDYALLDSMDHLIRPIISYRDHRTDHVMNKVFQLLSAQEIYNKTGIQFLPFNTLFQLFTENDEILKAIHTIMLVPDYLNYLLTGEKTLEVTNASTTQLLNIHTGDLDKDLLDLVKLKKQHFPSFTEPGTKIGTLPKHLLTQYNLPDATVISVASHDTASAVVGTPAQPTKKWAYLSSGTWSLIGIESFEPIMTTFSFERNFTNEYGAFSSYRFLKNLMGLWVIQEVQRLLPKKFSFEELVNLSIESQFEPPFIQLNDARFLNPSNMIKEIQQYCIETKQPVPTEVGEIAKTVYHNLAILVAISLDEIEITANQPIEVLHVVGGGAHNDYLNELIATYSQRITYAGPTEATAIGNLIMQLYYSKEISSIEEGRKLIRDSFTIKKFSPKPFNQSLLFEKFSTVTNSH